MIQKVTQQKYVQMQINKIRKIRDLKINLKVFVILLRGSLNVR
jgi:hypothetical protein